MSLAETDFSRLRAVLDEASRLLRGAETMNDDQFLEFAEWWQECVGAVRQISFQRNSRNQASVEKFEFGWGAQSLLFMIDVIPDIHSILFRHYSRHDVLRFADIGAGSGIGTNLIASIHSDNVVWSRFEVEAIDYLPLRKRWIATQYPKVTHTIAEMSELPDRHWDIVTALHVMEHTANPEEFISEIMRICKGFAFIYTPYNEVDRIDGHLSTITEKTFRNFPVHSIRIQKSMGWHPDWPEFCILAVLDCREVVPQRQESISLT